MITTIIVKIKVECANEFDGKNIIENDLSFPSETWDLIRDIDYGVDLK